MDIDHYAYVLLDNPEYLSGINRVIHFLGNAYLFSPSMEDKNRLIGEALRDICGEAMDAVLKIEQNWKEEVRDER